LSCIDPNFLINKTKTKTNINNLYYKNKNYASTSLSYLPPLNFYNHVNKNDKSSIKYYNNNNNDNDDSYRGVIVENKILNTKTTSQSIKEFSYFDWSKVKLYDTTNSSLIDIISTKNELNNNNTNNTLVTNSNDLPQVITIRFT
jgi:hypothetical protein